MELTKEYAIALFDYRDGELFWKVRPPSHFKTMHAANIFNSQRSGKKAGGEDTSPSGHRWKIRVDGIPYFRSRIVFLMHHGWLPLIVDHKNRDQLDDRIDNLRAATKSQNGANSRHQSGSASGLKGVSRHQKKWIARIKKDGKIIRLGSFIDPDKAHAAYVAKARELFGEFAYSGDRKPNDAKGGA